MDEFIGAGQADWPGEIRKDHWLVHLEDHHRIPFYRRLDHTNDPPLLFPWGPTVQPDAGESGNPLCPTLPENIKLYFFGTDVISGLIICKQNMAGYP